MEAGITRPFLPIATADLGRYSACSRYKFSVDEN
jgi:hypothetical protein